MNSRVKYAVYPGYVTSRNDGQRHFIGFSQLVRLYGVKVSECFDATKPQNRVGLGRHSYIRLTPRYSGDYSLPTVSESK